MPDPADQTDQNRPITNNFNGPVSLRQGTGGTGADRNADNNRRRDREIDDEYDDRPRRRRERDSRHDDPYRWRPPQVIACFVVAFLIVAGLVAWANGVGCAGSCSTVAEKKATAEIARLDMEAEAARSNRALIGVTAQTKLDTDKVVELERIRANEAIESRRAARDSYTAAVNAEARKAEAQYGQKQVIQTTLYPPQPPVVTPVAGTVTSPPNIRYTGRTCPRRDGSTGREGYDGGNQLGCWKY